MPGPSQGWFARPARRRIVGAAAVTFPGDERLDDQDVSPWVGVMALGVLMAALAAVAWLLVPVSHGPSGGNDQSHVSDRPLSRTLPAPHRPLDRMQRCGDVATTHGVPGCVAASFPPSAPPTLSARRVQRPTRPGALAVARSHTQVRTPSAPASPPPSTPASTPPTTPPTTPPSTPPSAAIDPAIIPAINPAAPHPDKAPLATQRSCARREHQPAAHRSPPLAPHRVHHRARHPAPRARGAAGSRKEGR